MPPFVGPRSSGLCRSCLYRPDSWDGPHQKVVRLLAVCKTTALLPKQSCSHEGVEERSDLLAADVESVSDLSGTERAIAQGSEDIKVHSREHRERGEYRHP